MDQPEGSRPYLRTPCGLSPNYFSFLVPEGLVDVARPVVERTGVYGLVSFRPLPRPGYRGLVFRTVVAARKMHAGKLTDVNRLFRKASFKMYFGSPLGPA
jgi:hypothetical protein